MTYFIRRTCRTVDVTPQLGTRSYRALVLVLSGVVRLSLSRWFQELKVRVARDDWKIFDLQERKIRELETDNKRLSLMIKHDNGAKVSNKAEILQAELNAARQAFREVESQAALLRQDRDQATEVARGLESKYNKLAREAQFLQQSHDDLQRYSEDVKIKQHSLEKEVVALRQRAAEAESKLGRQEHLEQRIREAQENQVSIDESAAARIAQLEKELELHVEGHREVQAEWNRVIDQRVSEWVDLCQKLAEKLEHTEAKLKSATPRAEIEARAARDAESAVQSKVSVLAAESSRLQAQLDASAEQVAMLAANLAEFREQSQASNSARDELQRKVDSLQRENVRLKRLAHHLTVVNASHGNVEAGFFGTESDEDYAATYEARVSPKTACREFDELAHTPVFAKKKENTFKRLSPPISPSRNVPKTDEKLAHLQSLVADMSPQTEAKRSRSALRRFGQLLSRRKDETPMSCKEDTV